jgi:PAS domain S-box-containing protein
VSTLIWALAIGVVYFLAARLGLALLSTPSGVAVFWPASGVAAGILMAFGRRARPALVMGVVAGTVAANLLSDRNLSTAVFEGFCNAGEAVLFVWLLERWFGPAFAFSDLRRALGFFAAALLAAAASALAGAATITLFHTAAAYSEVWRAWFLSDVIGITTTAPLVAGLVRMRHELPSRGELMAGLALISLMTLLAAHMVTHPSDSWLSFGPGYVELPLLLWLAARYPPAFAIVAAFVLSILVVGATVSGVGRFGDASVPIMERVRGAQLTVTMVTVLTLVLIALFAERNQREAALRLALDGAKLGTFSADLATGHLECDARAASIHGHPVPPTTIKESRRFVHRDDLVHIDADLAKARRRGGSWNAEYRVMPPPGHPHCGETRWVAVDGSFVRAARGIPARLRGVIRDITDRKRAEQAMAERNAQLELASRVARVGSFTVDFASSRVRLSPGCATLYGLPEGTMDMPRHDARAHVHPEELAWLEALRNQAFLEQKRELVAQFRIVRPVDGEIRWVEARNLIEYDKDGRPLHTIGVCIDVTERKQAEDHKSLLISELDHRVKNTLACVGVIVEQTRTASNTLDGFLEVLRGRIRSLANAHALLSYNRWHSVQLGEIVRNELTPCMRDGNTLIEGPAVEISADSVQPIAMVLHELATNAAKYGALSNGGGQIRVRWDLQSNASSRDDLIVQWRETGGPPVVAPSPPGYGMSVIRDLIPYELGGRVDHVFAADGVHCKMQIPSKWLRLRNGTSQRDASNEVSVRPH